MVRQPHALRSSGSLLADRRYAYAEGALGDGDAAAAADLAEQALELAPAFAPLHALLGRARARLGDRAGAAEALERALALEPADELGVRLDLARLGALPPEGAMSPGYVRALFDQYADRFDDHLRGALAYRGPELIRAALERACTALARPARFGRTLDLGCGTGLMGRALHDLCGGIRGVDLSPRMAALAAATGFYEEAVAGDLVAFLEAQEEGAAGLVTAADVFVYLARLDAALAAAARALEPGGLLAFSVQDAPGEAPTLGEDARFAHPEAYLRRLAGETGFAVALIEAASTRQDRGWPVPGFVAVLRRAR